MAVRRKTLFFKKATLFVEFASSEVSVTFQWSEGKKIELSDLQIKYLGNWRQVLKTTIKDLSGERLFPLGRFPTGAKLTIAFRVTAYDNGIEMVVIGSQQNPAATQQLAPVVPGTKSMASGEVWEDETLAFVVSGVLNA